MREDESSRNSAAAAEQFKAAGGQVQAGTRTAGSFAPPLLKLQVGRWQVQAGTRTVWSVAPSLLKLKLQVGRWGPLHLLFFAELGSRDGTVGWP